MFVDKLEAEMLKTNEVLADAQDAADIAFLRKRLERLNKKDIVLRRENVAAK